MLRRSQLLVHHVGIAVSNEVQKVGFDDFCPNKQPRWHILQKVHNAVDLWGIKNCPSDGMPVLNSVNEHIDDFSDLLLRKLGLDVLLERYELVTSSNLGLLVNLAVEASSWGVVLLAVREEPAAVEPEVLDKLDELCMILLALAREARNERRAQLQIWNPVPQAAEQRQSVLLARSLHPSQDALGNVLERDVNVLDDLVNLCYCIDEVLTEVARIAVEQPNPLYALDFCQLTEQITEPPRI
mmetsp:Transcript_1202/g.3714  ORF Transcript_1202/g.3714 Transcript_1202/m.3714 type:complete len:241 (-) Transcript_1202:807-1529(-)